jgi:hypothetical protein
MIGGIQRKKVVVIMVAMATFFSAQGMEIVIPNHADKILGVVAGAGFTIAAAAMKLDAPASKIPFLVGVAGGSLCYLVAREFTPSQIMNKMYALKKEIQLYSRIKHLMGEEVERNLTGVQGIVGGDWPLKAAKDDIEEYKKSIAK